MRLVDADAYSAEMKDRQAAAWKWRNEAIAEEDEVKLARAEGAYAAFTEAKLTMDKHIINPWHRVEEPPKESGEYIVAYHPCYWEDVDTSVTKVGIDNFRGKSAWAKKKFQRVTHWMDKPEPPKEGA